MTESQLTKKIIDFLRSKGALAVKIHGGTFQSRGLPDIIGCYKGLFFGLEVKLPGKEKTLTPLQAKKLADIRGVGGVGEMITTKEEAWKAVKHGYKNWESI